MCWSARRPMKMGVSTAKTKRPERWTDRRRRSAAARPPLPAHSMRPAPIERPTLDETTLPRPARRARRLAPPPQGRARPSPPSAGAPDGSRGRQRLIRGPGTLGRGAAIETRGTAPPVLRTDDTGRVEARDGPATPPHRRGRKLDGGVPPGANPRRDRFGPTDRDRHPIRVAETASWALVLHTEGRATNRATPGRAGGGRKSVGKVGGQKKGPAAPGSTTAPTLNAKSAGVQRNGCRAVQTASASNGIRRYAAQCE